LAILNCFSAKILQILNFSTAAVSPEIVNCNIDFVKPPFFDIKCQSNWEKLPKIVVTTSIPAPGTCFASGSESGDRGVVISDSSAQTFFMS
jgi:hypothetical protein